jgi:hypothetical protein
MGKDLSSVIQFPRLFLFDVLGSWVPVIGLPFLGDLLGRDEKPQTTNRKWRT